MLCRKRLLRGVLIVDSSWTRIRLRTSVGYEVRWQSGMKRKPRKIIAAFAVDATRQLGRRMFRHDASHSEMQSKK
jgi:hypothetical protein